MTFLSILGILSTLALSLAPVTILFTGLYKYKTFSTLLIFYLIAIGQNLLTLGVVNTDPYFIRSYSIANNLLEAPLILTFLLYYSTTTRLARNMKLLIGGFIVFEIILLSYFGITLQPITIIVGSGILLILSFSVSIFIKQTKNSIHHHKPAGKAMIATSLLFSYCCFFFLFIMYYIFKTHYKEDCLLIYFISTIISSIVLFLGLRIENKRVLKLNEVNRTRKELSQIYSPKIKAAPLETAFIDFEKNYQN